MIVERAFLPRRAVLDLKVLRPTLSSLRAGATPAFEPVPPSEERGDRHA